MQVSTPYRFAFPLFAGAFIIYSSSLFHHEKNLNRDADLLKLSFVQDVEKPKEDSLSKHASTPLRVSPTKPSKPESVLALENSQPFLLSPGTDEISQSKSIHLQPQPKPFSQMIRGRAQEKRADNNTTTRPLSTRSEELWKIALGAAVPRGEVNIIIVRF
jgi:hypothetical protein